MTKPFRLGMVGAGSVAALHADAAADLPGVEVAAVCDVLPQAAERLAERLGVRAHTSHGEMFAAAGLDGVVVTAPHSLHAPITLDAAAAGLHVLVEKPMATTAADCRRMIDACDRNGVRLAVGHVLHFVPTVRHARRVLDSGRLGRPILITERRTARYDQGSRPDWFFDPALAGGGIVMNVGTHSIDKTQWLAGSAATSVVGYVWNRPDLGVETDSIALVELANGVRVALSVTGAGLPFTDETEAVCEHGALRLSREDGLWIYQDGEAVQELAPDADDIAGAFADQLADFVASCRDGRPPAVGGEHGMSVVTTALGLYQSAAAGRPVRLDPPTQEAVA